MMRTLTIHTTALATLFAMSAVANPIQSGSMTTTGPKIASITVKAVPQEFTEPNTNGGFSRISAGSFDSLASPDWDKDSKIGVTTPMPYAVGTPYATKQTSRAGDKYEAQSKVTVDVTKLSAKEVTWTATAANFGIDVLAPTGTTGESAKAVWFAQDPMHFELLSPGDLIFIDLLPDNGWIIPETGPENLLQAMFQSAAGTDLPGLETLFELTIAMSSLAVGDVDVTFHSNPLLGLNDAAIAGNLQSRYTYDPSTATYNFNSAGGSLGMSFAIPEGITSVTVSSSLGAELDASSPGVPEPATLALTGGALVGAGLVRRRRTARGRGTA